MEESSEDRIQRALNAHFSEEESKAPPEIESQFLQNIEEFERQYENAERMSIRQFIGNPSFKPIGEILSNQIETELGSILERLAKNSIQVDFLSSVPAEERYRFITEELLDEEIDDIRIGGFTHHFIYEEFHPNDQHGAPMYAGDFLRFLLGGDVKFAMNAFCKDELFDASGSRTTLSVMEERVREFSGKIMTFVKKEIEPIDCQVEGDYASVRINVRWDGLMAETLEVETFSGIAHVRMRRSPYEGWDVVQAIVPGWNAER
ncbi:MAG: hypothetical protein AAB393_08940 [Bacteroidota bacterium]|mgnify:CR=1 FL=1